MSLAGILSDDRFMLYALIAVLEGFDYLYSKHPSKLQASYSVDDAKRQVLEALFQLGFREYTSTCLEYHANIHHESDTRVRFMVDCVHRSLTDKHQLLGIIEAIEVSSGIPLPNARLAFKSLFEFEVYQ